MKKSPWLFVFAVVLAGDIAAIQLKNEMLQYICKPLIVLALMGWFVSGTRRVKGNIRQWVPAALFFSWLGDILLMFQGSSPDFFLFGLSAFLIAHIFYIIFFHQIRIREGIKGKPYLLLPVAAYYAGLIIWLSPKLGDFSLPVKIYGIVISFMLMLTLHMAYIRNKKAGQQMITGALLFIISDSVLAIDKFYVQFEGAGIIIMIAYGLAQFFLVKGAINYLNSKQAGYIVKKSNPSPGNE